MAFSGSHLHEALPVTRGKRHMLLSFLFGEGIAAPAAFRWYKTGTLRGRGLPMQLVEFRVRGCAGYQPAEKREPEAASGIPAGVSVD